MPIYLYGMGDGAQKIIYMLTKYGIKLHGIYASDEYVRGHSFNGYKVKRLSEVRAEHNDRFVTLLAFATEREPLLSYLYSLSEELPFYAPDVEVADFCGEAFDCEYLQKHRASLEWVYERLEDDISKKVFDAVINFKLSGKPQYLKEISTPKTEIFRAVLRPNSREFFLDIGAFRGDTIESFLKEAGGASRIYGLEPDIKNYKKLDMYCKSLRDSKIPINADCLNAAAWDKDEVLTICGGDGGRNASISGADNKSVQAADLKLAQQAAVKEINAVKPDTLFKSETDNITFMKLDAEGAEKRVLLGSKEIIKRAKPKLLLSAYHRNEDLFMLPQTVFSIREDYRMYLRHHPYIPAWETCFYFV